MDLCHMKPYDSRKAAQKDASRTGRGNRTRTEPCPFHQDIVFHLTSASRGGRKAGQR